MMGERDAAGGTRSARQRKERRLRLCAKHEQLSVAMALATVTHHSFQVGTAYDALRSQKPVTSAGGMPPPLLEGRPHERIQRHAVEQIADSVLVVSMLFMVEQQMEEQLVDKLSPLDFHVAEQIIDVPKIVCPPSAARTVLCAPQTAEQLVEVLTAILFFEQNVDIPIPQVGVSGGGQQGFLSRQGSVGGQYVDIPASGRDLFTWVSTCPTLPSGCSFSTPPRASLKIGTDAPRRLPGSHLPASGSSGLVRYLREEGSGSGTGAPVSAHMTSLLCLLCEAHRGEGPLAPSRVPPLQEFGVCVLPVTYTLASGSGCFRVVRIAGSTVDTKHVSVVGGFWLLFRTFPCEGEPRILTSILGQNLAFPRATRIRQSLVRCFGRGRCTGNSGFTRGRE